MKDEVFSRELKTWEKESFCSILQKFGVRPLILALVEAGASVYCVGGAVRDLILSRGIQDLDFEIHNLEESAVLRVLSQFGSVASQGKSFGVLRVSSFDVDWSLPRLDGQGRRPEVVIDPFMGLIKALRRRDLTMNALALDPITYRIFDPFDGEKDIHTRVLRAVDKKTFIEDPLRFYRVMQFLARFEMVPDTQLDRLCKEIDISSVSKERIFTEINKLLLLSQKPSTAFLWLQKIDRLAEIFPELEMLIGVEQNPVWHPEGDVFVHTMQVLDAVVFEDLDEPFDRLVLSYAALCHDMGKVVKTKKHPSDGRIISYGHEEAGVVYAKSFLQHITDDKRLCARVVRLVLYHMRPCALVRGGAKCGAYRRLAARLAPETLYFLGRMARVDKRGRNGADDFPLRDTVECVELFWKKADACGVLHRPQEPVLRGSDIMAHGFVGSEIGDLLARAYEYQIVHGETDKEVLLKYLGL